MRKAYAFLLVLLLCLVLASCDSGLTGIMQKMGENVFGMEADTSEVDAAQEKLDGSVEYKGDKAEIDWKQAASVASDVAGMIDSQQLKDKVSEKMQEPVSGSTEEALKVSAAMKEQMSAVATAVSAIVGEDSSLPESGKAVLQTVGEALAVIRDSIGDNPTKGDLATVAMVGDLADKAMEAASLAKTVSEQGEGASEAEGKLNEMAIDVISTIYALKTISGSVSTIGSSLENLDVAVLLSEDKTLEPKDVEDADADEFGRKLAGAIGPVLRNLNGLMEENGSYSESAAKKLVLDMQAMRTAYEVFALTLNPTDSTSIETSVNAAIALIKGESTYPLQQWARTEAGLTFDDIVYYAFAVVLTEKPSLQIHSAVSAYLSGVSVKDSVEGLSKLDGVTEAEEMTFFNTSAVLADASGWTATIAALAGEDLTAENVLNVFHAH